MNYFKKSFALLLVTGLMISNAQAGIKLEVNGCDIITPAIKGSAKALAAGFKALSRVRVPTISYVSPTAHTITTLYKNLAALAAGTLVTGCSAFLAYVAYDCYEKSKNISDKVLATGIAAFSILGAIEAGYFFFDPALGGLQVVEYIG